jgi:hypothetical protein
LVCSRTSREWMTVWTPVPRSGLPDLVDVMGYRSQSTRTANSSQVRRCSTLLETESDMKCRYYALRSRSQTVGPQDFRRARQRFKQNRLFLREELQTLQTQLRALGKSRERTGNAAGEPRT